jgi:hypothetical protein
MQAYAQYLPDKMKKEREKCVCIFCCKTAAISASFTPPATFRFQPLPAVAFLGIDVDITFHHITSQFSALASALLGVVWCCSQISALLAALAATMAAAATGADGAGGETMG